MNTCDSCKWWTPPTKHITKNYDGGETLWLAVMGDCLNPLTNATTARHRFGEEPKAAPNAASANANRSLECGPKFGCVLHEI